MTFSAVPRDASPSASARRVNGSPAHDKCLAWTALLELAATQTGCTAARLDEWDGQRARKLAEWGEAAALAFEDVREQALGARAPWTVRLGDGHVERTRAGITLWSGDRAVAVLQVAPAPSTSLAPAAAAALQRVATVAQGLLHAPEVRHPPDTMAASPPADMERLLRQSIEAFNAGVMISAPDGTILLTNARWRLRMGLTAQEPGLRWPQLLRRLIDNGHYPDAQGREDAFFEWRLRLADSGQPQEIRLRDGWVLSKDERLPDGCVAHFSINISQAKQHAAALEASEAKLSALLHALPDLWFVIDPQGRYEAAHESHPLLAGRFADLKGRRFGCDVPLELSERGDEAIARAHATGEAQRLEYTLDVNGQSRHFEARLSPMPEGRTLFVARDMTARIQAAEKLRVSEELYRSVASSINEGLVVVQLDGRVAALNPAGCRILGVSPTELIGQVADEATGYALLTDDLAAPLPRGQWPITRTVETGQRAIDSIHPLRRRDGQLVWLQISTHLLRLAPESAPFAVVATLRDITRERQAVQALAQSEERWKFALDGAGDGVWDWDAAAGHMFYSARWKAMLGYAEHEIGERLEELTDRIHPEDRSAVVSALEDYLQRERGLFQAEFRMRHKLGHDVWILSRGKIVSRDEQGRFVRVVGTHSDITPLKRAEQVLRDKQTAEAASTAKSEFLSRMSHEIRTPLNAVNGFAQLLKLQLAATSGQHLGFVEQILHAGQHLTALVNDVLDLQKVEAGVLSLQVQPLAVGDEIAQCTAMLAPLAAHAGIALQVDGPMGLHVLGDRQRLRQVLMNIGSNAIKYNRRGGSVRYAGRRCPDGSVELSIEDTGPGMNAEELTRLFQPFERLGRETSSIEGSGLGLIITRSLIEAMGGHMEIRSQPGIGTRVNIVLPAAEERSPCPYSKTEPAVSNVNGSEQHDQLPTASRPLHVLYVEDNRINAMLFEEALRPYSQLTLDIAEDGQAAVEMASKNPPDVLVLDAHLPGMTGFDVLRVLRSLPHLAHTPAFMCSADAMPDDVAKAKAAGFTGYWTKPIDIQHITDELCRLAELGEQRGS